MKNLPIISGWEPEQYRWEASALRRQAESVLAGKWCQGAAAFTADGEDLTADPRDIITEGVCFCAGSHIDYFTPYPILGAQVVDQARGVYESLDKRHIVAWNDTPGRKAYQVARAFRAAAARAERYARILEAERVPA